LNELAIATAIGIDKQGEDYRVSVQILNPGEIAGSSPSTRSAVSTFITDGRSLSEAFRKITKDAPRRIYLSHVRIVVFGEELARDGITQSLDFLSRNYETRTDFYLIVAKNNLASNILKIMSPIEKVPANKIYGSIEVAEKTWAPVRGTHLDDIISEIISDGNNPVLTGIEYEGDLAIGNDLDNVEKVYSPSFLTLDNLALFKGDKLIDWLSTNESKGYNYINDNVDATIGVMDCEEDKGKITVEIVNSKTEMKATVKNGKPKVSIRVTSEGEIEEINKCKRKITDEETIRWIEKRFNEQKTKKMEMAIAKAKELKSDVFGFGDSVNRADPKTWQKLKENWDDEVFPELEIDIKAELTIRRLGSITDSFQ
jgi:spore germination protein KC